MIVAVRGLGAGAIRCPVLWVSSVALDHDGDAHARGNEPERYRCGWPQGDARHRGQDHDQHHRASAADRQGHEQPSIRNRRVIAVAAHRLVPSICGSSFVVVS